MSWMLDAEGKPDKSVRDCGDGTYTVTPVDKYGVHFAFTRNNVRLYGTAPDLGACEYYAAPGLMLLVK